MTSATAIVRAGSSLKRTGEPLDDSHRTTTLSAGCEPKRTNKVDLQGLQQILVNTPRTRKKIMGEREDEQALKLNETMDELSSTVNQCLIQLTLETQKVEQSTGASVTQLRVALNKKQSLRLPTDENQHLRAELGRMEARLALAAEEKELLHQQACAAQHALKLIRHEAHLLRDKMLVDAKNLCQYHVDKMAEMSNRYQGELQNERSKMHNSNKHFREKLEQEALEYQQEVSRNTEQSVQVKLNQEIAKIQAEMTKVIEESATSRSQLKAQFEHEMASVRAAYEQEHAVECQETDISLLPCSYRFKA
eukprot:5770310-Amphidinium_carterae.1